MYNLGAGHATYQRTVRAVGRDRHRGPVVPLVVLGPVGGAWSPTGSAAAASRGSPGDLARLVLMLGLALVAAAHLPVLLAPVIAALATAAGAPYLPCVSAVTPRLVRGADLPGANAARSAVTKRPGLIAGPALGGVLLACHRVDRGRSRSTR